MRKNPSVIMKKHAFRIIILYLPLYTTNNALYLMKLEVKKIKKIALHYKHFSNRIKENPK